MLLIPCPNCEGPTAAYAGGFDPSDCETCEGTGLCLVVDRD